MATQRKSVGGARTKVGTPKGRGSSDIRLPGEKAVRGTKKSVPVKPASDNPGGPSDPAAVDRRRQIVGTDDPGGRSGKRR